MGDVEYTVPDWIAAAVGWRAWRVEMLMLQSVSMGEDNRWWPTRRPLKATCYEKKAFLWTWLKQDDPRRCHLPVVPEVPTAEVGNPEFRSREQYEQAKPPGKHKGWEYRLLPHQPAPCENHQCGIYAVDEPRRVAHYANYQRAIGTVSLWGKTVPGDNGWRAEFAYPKELWIPCKPEDLEARTLIADLLAREYGVPVHVGLSQEIVDARLSGYVERIESLVAE